jgi:hypothetical protein
VQRRQNESEDDQQQDQMEDPADTLQDSPDETKKAR